MKAMIFGMMMIASVAVHAKTTCSVNARTEGNNYNTSLVKKDLEGTDMTLNVGNLVYAMSFKDETLSLGVLSEGKPKYVTAATKAQSVVLFDIENDRLFVCYNY
jgi:hypothetical protein